MDGHLAKDLQNKNLHLHHWKQANTSELQIGHIMKPFIDRETEFTESQLAHVASGMSIPLGNLCTSRGNGGHVRERTVGNKKK